MADRVTLFIDYQNVHGWARRCFYPLIRDPAVGHVDPLRLGQYIVERRRRPSQLEQVRIYRGRPNPDKQATAAAANDRQTAGWERSGLVHVTRRPLKYPKDWPDTPASEKGIDVALAIDMVRLAMQGAYDVAVLVSADTDLLPALETVTQLKLAHVELAAWSGTRRLRFPNSQLPWCHFIDEPTYRTLEDPTDYTQP
ncbi:NYN domain-containing protein [Kineosporia sp. A_224]|uniref:NYN domain-containing protein n=1 Tax=Kineosporia sp. A_224 TaxID=1962180 RepID=UPI000B4BD25A|nr:NYN domain-containing protein [Kineosporia sp. A_224]